MFIILEKKSLVKNYRILSVNFNKTYFSQLCLVIKDFYKATSRSTKLISESHNNRRNCLIMTLTN